MIALFALKVAVLSWNAWACHPFASYDLAHHQERVLDGGIVPRQRAYNGPLYYMPVLPQIWAGEKDSFLLMKELQYLNVVYIAAFYALWLFLLFPKVLPHWTNRTVASIALLALPGFQRLAASVHPDNLLVLFTSLCFASWLWQKRSAVNRWRGNLRSAIIIGLTGLTRPFSVVPVGIFTSLLVHFQLARGLRAGGLLRAAAVTLVAGALAGSWWATRVAALDKPMNVYVKGHDRWQKKRVGFDYAHYYRSFYLGQLVSNPNRHIAKQWKGKPHQNPLANSFFTTLYSDSWGDHWLRFSETRATMNARRPTKSRAWFRLGENKAGAKSVALALAWPFTLVLLYQLITGTASTLRRALRWRELTPAFVATTVFFAGFGLFVYWQVTDGLQPGKHSSIKFHYMAYTVAFALVPAFSRVFRRRWWFATTLIAALTAFGGALPVATVWP